MAPHSASSRRLALPPVLLFHPSGLVCGLCVLAVGLSLRLLLAMMRYCDLFPGICFLGDNLAALQLALSGKAKGAMGALARELFMRRVRGDWLYSVAHLPAEHNYIADYVSRLRQPGAPTEPLPELSGAAEVQIPALASIWSL